jgi:hypothetical protein
MIQNNARTLGSVNANLRPVVAAVSLTVLLGALALVLFATLASPMKDDIAWLLYVARRWMAGQELYVDVVEVNPPLIVWLSAVPLELSRWLGANPKFVAMPAFIAMVLGCGWWAACLLHRQGGLFRDRATVFGAIGTVLLVVPGGDLGQREHLLVAAMLPYLVLFAGSLEGRHPRWYSALAAGVVAGLGCALKPRYAGVFVVLEGLALTQGLRPWRLLPIAASVTMAGYGGAVALFCPAYLRRAVPLALALYGGTDVSFVALLRDSSVVLGGEVAVFLLLWLSRRDLPERKLLLTLAVFAATSSAICFVDGKDWFYHRLPATIAVILALLGWAAAAFASRNAEPRSRRLQVALCAVAGLTFLVTSFQRMAPEVMQAMAPQNTTEERLETLVRKEHVRTYIAFSEWIALGFPVVNNTGAAWASRFDSMWALKGELWRARFDPTTTRQWPIARWVAHDFIAGCPDMAVVDTREGVNYIDVLGAADPAFLRVWSRYRPIAAFDGLVVYRRGKAGCIDPWVAAQVTGETRVR